MDNSKVKLAIAPINWTNDDMPDLGKEITFEQCVSEMALAGFSGTEVGNKYPNNPKVLKKALDLRNLQVCNQWFSSYLTTKTYEEVEKAFIAQLDFLEPLGCRIIGPAEQGLSVQGLVNTPVLSAKPFFSDEQWKRLTNGLNKLGEIAKDRGFKLCYHHHMGTGCQTVDEVDRLLEHTDASSVYLLYDTGHFAFSAHDPLEMLKRYGNRIGHVHLKDLRKNVFEKVKKEDLSFLDSIREGVFTVPGDGMIDFVPIFKFLESIDYHGWMVVEAEQDPAKANPLEYALKARSYIKSSAGF